jgi:hypothetical protein
VGSLAAAPSCDRGGVATGDSTARSPRGLCRYGAHGYVGPGANGPDHRHLAG